MSDEKKKPVVERWTYVGRRIDDGDLYFAYEDADGVGRFYKKSLTPSGVVGGVYDLHVTRDDKIVSVTLNRASYVGRVEDRDSDRAQWIAADAAAKTAHDAAKREKSDKSETSLGALTLDQLRAQIRRLPTPQRRALIACALDYLRI